MAFPRKSIPSPRTKRSASGPAPLSSRTRSPDCPRQAGAKGCRANGGEACLPQLACCKQGRDPLFVFSPLATRHSPPLFTSAVDLAHGPSDCACVLHRRPYLRPRVNRHSRNARLLHRQAGFRMSRDVAGSPGLRHRGARPAGDSFPLRRAAHRQSGQIRGRIAPGFRVCTYKP